MQVKTFIHIGFGYPNFGHMEIELNKHRLRVDDGIAFAPVDITQFWDFSVVSIEIEHDNSGHIVVVVQLEDHTKCHYASANLQTESPDLAYLLIEAEGETK